MELNDKALKKTKDHVMRYVSIKISQNNIASYDREKLRSISDINKRSKLDMGRQEEKTLTGDPNEALIILGVITKEDLSPQKEIGEKEEKRHPIKKEHKEIVKETLKKEKVTDSIVGKDEFVETKMDESKVPEERKEESIEKKMDESKVPEEPKEESFEKKMDESKVPEENEKQKNNKEEEFQKSDEFSTENKPGVIVVDSDSEAEEFRISRKMQWKFGGGTKIGNVFFFSKIFKPTVYFKDDEMDLCIPYGDSAEVRDESFTIVYNQIQSVMSFVGKSRCKCCFRFILKKPLELDFLEPSVDNNIVELHSNEFVQMVETGFVDKLKSLPNLRGLMFNSQNGEKANHNYNTRMAKRKSMIITHSDFRISKLERLKTFVVYPKSEESSNQIIVTKRDINFLKPHKMLNDTIIDFYLKYLHNNIKDKNIKSNIFIFNTFFYNMLASNPANVRTWAKKCKIFDKDYIVIPINEGMHWKVVIVCFAMNSVRPKSEWGAENNHPRIVTLDSMKGRRKINRVLDKIRSYLTEEYNIRYQKKFEFDEINLKELEMSLSKQVNSFDCGVYLLEYIERFCTNPFEDTSSRNTLNCFNFKPDFITNKRKSILNLLYNLKKEEE